MIEEQLRHRLASTAEEVDPSAAPLDTIRQVGSSLERRRARLRVAGFAATAVAGVALAVPALGPGPDGPGTDRPDAAEAPQPDPELEEFLPDPELEEFLQEQLVTAGPAQRQAFEDNRVTRAEYRAGFDGYEQCLAGRGHQLGSVDRSGTVIEYVVPAEAVDSGADASCYQRHFRVLDMAWQGAQPTRTDDATTMRLVNDCLEANGLSPGSRPGEAIHLMMAAGLTAEECGLPPGQID